MDSSSSESLKKVVQERNLDFLRSAATSGPDECFERLVSPEGNIFHIIAASQNNVEFIDEAMKILPASVVKSLLCQSQEVDDEENPLHVAARKGHYKIVKRFLDYFRSSISSSDTQSIDESTVKKPWLVLDKYRRTPLHSALEFLRERIALEILSMDVVLLSSMEDMWDRSPLYFATTRKFKRVALQILTSAPNCSFSGDYGQTALYCAAECSDKIFKLLVEKAPQLIIGRDSDGNTVLHYWIRAGKLDVFQYVLNSNVIEPHLRRDFIDQLSTTAMNHGNNPLHDICLYVNDDGLSVKIARVLVNAYKQERAQLFLSPEFRPPWFMEDENTDTPLHKAIRTQKEELALYLLSLDSIKFLEDDGGLLFCAIENKSHRVAEEILRIVQQDARLTIFLTRDNGQNALHYAPKCTESFLTQLLETHPEFITEVDDDGLTVLHSWTEIGEYWPFEYMIKRDDINPQLKSSFIDLFLHFDIKGRLPLHLAAISNFEQVMVDFVKLLLDASYPTINLVKLWSARDENNATPLGLAISNRHEKLALLFLSMDNTLDYVEADLLFKAIEYECHGVVKFLLEWAAQCGNKKFLKSNECNVLHLAWKSTEENGKLIVENWPELINEDDNSRKKPLERASEAGTTWLVELILQKDRSSLIKAPLAWVEACKNGHVSAILAFIKKSPYFRYICREHQEGPLHHLENVGYEELQELVKNHFIKELKNTRNRNGETPLHTAIRRENKDLAEVLLTTYGVDWNIKDNSSRSAKDLLKEKCEMNLAWADMCKIIGVDPKIKTTYIQVKTDLSKMRETISLVAALLATITFTAAFTVPGGFDDKDGEAILTKKVAFLVFLLTDTYAMCCSMLILFCVIWSLICDQNRSSSLIDRSLELLKHSLYGTLLAFMTGVYTVIHKKSLWAAIVVIVMCSLVVILAQRRVLYTALDKLNSCLDKSSEAKGQFLLYRKKQSSHIKSFFRGRDVNTQEVPAEDETVTYYASNNQSEHEESTPQSNQNEDKTAAPLSDQNEEDEATPLSNQNDPNEVEETAYLSDEDKPKIDSIV